MDPLEIQSSTGLEIQCAGIFLVTILSFFMTRSIRRTSLDYWSVGWGCLSVGLLALTLSFHIKSAARIFQPVYLFGEYSFGLLFIAGCLNYATGKQLERKHLRLLIGAAVLALAIPQISSNFNSLFVPHAVIIAGLFAGSFFALQPARLSGRASAGVKVMSVALVLLTLDFLHYAPVMAYAEWISPKTDFGYLRYTSIYDMILEILLGFGTVMAVMEDVQRELKQANGELIAARDRLEILVKLDPLTEALNRHAFYSLLEKSPEIVTEPVSGCVAVIDIDNLKPINDSLGHTAGDAAIREVAKCIRSVIRADDLLFRWGGDEFMILLFNISHIEARRRIDALNSALAETRLPGSSQPVPLVVSSGFAAFEGLANIEGAIEQADGAMYARKQARRSQPFA